MTFATAAVKTPHHVYVCRFFVSGYLMILRTSFADPSQVGLAEGTFYPAVHTVLGGWYTKRGNILVSFFVGMTTYISQSLQNVRVYFSRRHSLAQCLVAIWYRCLLSRQFLGLMFHSKLPCTLVWTEHMVCRDGVGYSYSTASSPYLWLYGV